MADDNPDWPDLQVVLSPGEPGHCVNTYMKCPADPTHEGYEFRNYNEMFRDGDVHCAVCGTFIRMYFA